MPSTLLIFMCSDSDIPRFRRLNKSPELTAVGAASSIPQCGTVHGASRRLSYAR
jgi:hypothetical protein